MNNTAFAIHVDGGAQGHALAYHAAHSLLRGASLRAPQRENLFQSSPLRGLL